MALYLRRLDAAVLADRASRRSRRPSPRAPPLRARTRVDNRRASRRRARVTIDARAPVQRPRRRAAGCVPHPLADGARRAAPPRERATGGPHLARRRLHLRVRLLARLHEAPRRTAGALPKADQELPLRLTRRRTRRRTRPSPIDGEHPHRVLPATAAGRALALWTTRSAWNLLMFAAISSSESSTAK